MLAAQLLAETTAKTLKYFGNKGLLKSKDWEETSRFIHLCDSWFDLMNSRVPFDKRPSRHAFGLHLEVQRNTLNRMIDTAQTLKVTGSKCMYQFQKGLVSSSESLKKLYEMVKSRYGISYILTYRLNQLVAENCNTEKKNEDIAMVHDISQSRRTALFRWIYSF